MAKPSYNVLFLCTGNSARSILAESLLNAHGQGRFVLTVPAPSPRARSGRKRSDCWSHSAYRRKDYARKSWDEFVDARSPHMDFVITVCDQAAGEVCPIWPGKPMTAHWSVPDPVTVDGSPAEISLAFCEALRMLERRVLAFTALPLTKLDAIAIKQKMDEIGSAEAPASSNESTTRPCP
jgi:arsenate reductase (thioredoxin)